MSLQLLPAENGKVWLMAGMTRFEMSARMARVEARELAIAADLAGNRAVKRRLHVFLGRQARLLDWSGSNADTLAFAANLTLRAADAEAQLAALRAGPGET